MKWPVGLVILSVIALGVFAVLRSDREGARSGMERAPAEADGIASGPRDSASGGVASVSVLRATPGDSDAGAVVEGTVVYSASAEHRWRQARYYVDSRKGGLAEAVVSLRGANLRGFPRDGESETRTMDQKNYQFAPETLALLVGDSVKFTNSDREIHSVRTADGSRPFNVSLAHGSEHVQEFRNAGGSERPIRIGCVFHGSMRAWIFVFDHPFFHVTGSDGRFRFQGVPPGEYWLDMIHPAGELRWSQRIEIRGGDPSKFDIRISPADRVAVKRAE